MKPEERIPELCTQLLRADNPAVLKTVAAEIKEAVDTYVQSKDGSTPALESQFPKR
jgi:hypothetical protein